MDTSELEKGKTFNVADIIEYIPNSVNVKSILKKITGNVIAVSFDSGEALKEKVIPFDSLIQIVDGKAEIIINGVSNLLIAGQSIIIPAHALKIIKATERLKLISIVIKSGYE